MFRCVTSLHSFGGQGAILTKSGDPSSRGRPRGPSQHSAAMAAGPTPFAQELDQEQLVTCLGGVAKALQAELKQDGKTDLIDRTRALVGPAFAEQGLPNIMASTVLHGRDLALPGAAAGRSELLPLDQVRGKIVSSTKDYVEIQRSQTMLPWCNHALALWDHDFVRLPTPLAEDCRRFVLFMHEKRKKCRLVTWGLLAGDGGQTRRLDEARGEYELWPEDGGSAQLVEPGLVVKSAQPGHHVVFVTIRASSWKAPPQPEPEPEPEPEPAAAAAAAAGGAALPVLAEAAAAATPSPGMVERVEELEKENKALKDKIKELEEALRPFNIGSLAQEHLRLSSLLANQTPTFLNEVEMLVRHKIAQGALGAPFTGAGVPLPLPPQLRTAAGIPQLWGSQASSLLSSPARGGAAAAAGGLHLSPARDEGLAAASLGKRPRMAAPIAVPAAPAVPAPAAAPATAEPQEPQEPQSPPPEQVRRRQAALPSSGSLPSAAAATAVAAAAPASCGSV